MSTSAPRCCQSPHEPRKRPCRSCGNGHAAGGDQLPGAAAKTSKNIAMRTAMARFPFEKPLETFDFTYQPSIDSKQVQQLATCHYIEHGDNMIVLGPPCVGKSHLAVSLGMKAVEHGYRVLFTTAAHLIAVLTKALAEGRLDEELKYHPAAAHRR